MDNVMGVIRKTKLYWAASDTASIVGYRLYWAQGDQVDRGCACIEVGKVTEAPIPEQAYMLGGPVMFGITAIDRSGHESEMTTLARPFRPHLPKAPQRLFFKPSRAFCITRPLSKEKTIPAELIQRLIAPMQAGDIQTPVCD